MALQLLYILRLKNIKMSKTRINIKENAMFPAQETKQKEIETVNMMYICRIISLKPKYSTN